MANIGSILKKNVAGKLLNHGIVFLINICIVRLLGAAVSGHYFNELYVLNCIVFLCSCGLDYAAIAWISKQPELYPVIHKRLHRISIWFMFVIALVAVFFIFNTRFFFNQSFYAIVFFSTGNLMLIFFQGLLTAQKKFNRQNIILVISNLMYLIFLCFFIPRNPTSLLMQISSSYALLFILQGFLMLAFSAPSPQSTHHPIQWGAFFRYGFFIMISALIYFVFLRVDNYFVERFSDPVTLGNYVQCGKIGQYFLYFTSIISSTLLPFVGSDKLLHSFSEWKKIMSPYVFVVIVITLLLALAGRWLYPFLFGSDFSEMSGYMLILLPGYFSLGMLTLINAVYIGKGNIKKIIRGDLMGLILVLGLNSMFASSYGARAAAIISSFSYTAVFVYLLWDLKNQFESD
ncbi:MAG: hypothetical protein FGM46_03005 [Ferruginibacter sp.]|nr:hypothetical protein [Ferruginibacter sp.]